LVRAITDAAGDKVESAVYKPFGEQTEWLSPAAPAPEAKGWIGERFDASAGLQDLNARYYDPELGMFLQPDWFEVTQPGVGRNRYSYSFNDPVNGRDPGGNNAESGYVSPYVAGALTNEDENAGSNDESSGVIELAQVSTTGRGGGRVGVQSNPAQSLLNVRAAQLMREIDTLRAQQGLPPQTRVSSNPPSASPETISSLLAERAILQAATAPLPTSRALALSEFPPNNGALGGYTTTITLQPGTIISRYGPLTGSFVAPENVPLPNRSMRSTTDSQSLNRYEVVKPIPGVEASVAAPAFGQPGGGIQYRLPAPVGHYLGAYLREIR